MPSKLQMLADSCSSLSAKVDAAARKDVEDDRPGIFYVTWRGTSENNKAGEVKKIRVVAENEEKAKRQSGSSLAGGSAKWEFVKAERP